MRIGETIAEYSGAALRVDATDDVILRFSGVTEPDVAVGVQGAWDATSSSGSAAQFHWPAVFNRHPEATTFALHAGEDSSCGQALIQCYENCHVPCDRLTRRPITNVSFLEIAPWNKSNTKHRRFRGLGAFLVVVMSSVALQRGSSGALALHSLENATGFYRRLGFEEIDCFNEYKELYFELSDERALALRKGNGVFP